MSRLFDRWCRSWRPGYQQRIATARRLHAKAAPYWGPPEWVISGSLKQREIESRFSTITAGLHFVAHFLVICEASQTGPLNCRNVNKYIAAAIVRGNKAEAFCGVEPFDGASCHRLFS